MGKGQTQRRRIANVLKSSHGNLHKAQRRRGSRHLPLPNAPKEDDFKEKLPRSLRKLQLLKAVAEKETNSGQNTEQERSEKPSKPEGAASKKKQKHASDTTEQVSTADAEKLPKLKAGQDAPMPPPELESKSTKKKRKKEYMRQKDAKKRSKVSDMDLPVEKEQELLMKTANVPKFGEQAAAPPAVNLKRKHWDPKTSQEAASERCQKLFVKQMQEATKRAAVVASLASGRTAPKPKLKAAERDALRQKVITAYRQQRNTAQAVGAANNESLAELVRQNEARSSEARIR